MANFTIIRHEVVVFNWIKGMGYRHAFLPGSEHDVCPF